MIRVAACVGLLLALLSADVLARGGGRGGGGFVRGGAAAGGSIGQRPSGGMQRGGFSGRGPAASGTFAGQSTWARNDPRQPDGDWQERHQENVERRQERRDEVREDRQEYTEDRREDWQEYADEHRDDQYWGTGYYDEGVYYYQYGDDVVGGDPDVPVEAPPNWSLDCEPNVVVVGRTTYYQCGSAWYVRVYRDGEVAYAMTNPPAGY